MNRFSNTPEVFSLQDEENFFDNIWSGIEKAGNNIAGGIINEGDKWVQDQIGIKSPANPNNAPQVYGPQEAVPVNNLPTPDYPPVTGEPAPQVAKFSSLSMPDDMKMITSVALGAGATAIAKYGFKTGWITSLLVGTGTGFASHYAVKKLL